VRKLNERDGKMMVLVECESQGEAESVKVQNDSINLDGNGMSFNNNKVLMWRGKPAETKLKEIYGNSLETSHINYATLSQKSKSKNKKKPE